MPRTSYRDRFPLSQRRTNPNEQIMQREIASQAETIAALRAECAELRAGSAASEGRQIMSHLIQHLQTEKNSHVASSVECEPDVSLRSVREKIVLPTGAEAPAEGDAQSHTDLGQTAAAPGLDEAMDYALHSSSRHPTDQDAQQEQGSDHNEGAHTTSGHSGHANGSGTDQDTQQVLDHEQGARAKRCKKPARVDFKRHRCYRSSRFAGQRHEYTDEEIKFLRQGFKGHGSKWSLILKKGKAVFHPCRSSQCLKDKWRSLQKAEKRARERDQRKTMVVEQLEQAQCSKMHD